LHQQLQKLHLAYYPIVVLIHIPKKLPYFLLGSQLILEELGYLLKGDFPTIINIKVAKSLLEMPFINLFIEVHATDQKLSIVNKTRTISIKILFNQLYFLIGAFKEFLITQCCCKLIYFDYPVIIFIQLFKHSQQL